jgi:hypothetical protein
VFTGIVQGTATVVGIADRAGLRSIRLRFRARLRRFAGHRRQRRRRRHLPDGDGATGARPGRLRRHAAEPGADHAGRAGGRQPHQRRTRGARRCRDRRPPAVGPRRLHGPHRQLRRPENNCVLRFAVPAPWMRYVFAKGYIAVNGASLTVAEAWRERRRQRLVRGLADPGDAAHDHLRQQGRGGCAQHRDRAPDPGLRRHRARRHRRAAGAAAAGARSPDAQQGKTVEDLAAPATLPRP